MKLGIGTRMMGRKLLGEGEVWARDGRSGDFGSGGGVGGLHGEPVLEMLDALGGLTSDNNGIKDEWAGDGEVASRVTATGGRLEAEALLELGVRHVVAGRWEEAEGLVASGVPERRTVCGLSGSTNSTVRRNRRTRSYIVCC